jgi:hypothetical protein
VNSKEVYPRPPERSMMVRLPASLLDRYERATLYNSPYVAHRQGRAVDLYPASGAPSPVGGTVRDVTTVTAPEKPYADEHDHLVLVDVEEPDPLSGLVARLLHVDPAVEAGQRIEPGESVGELLRSGYYAPWVDDHVHLGLREPDDDLYRASGSLRLTFGPDVLAVPWGGGGTVVETGETYVVLDGPRHPDPGSWAGIAASEAPAVLDGGLAHYDGGGLVGVGAEGYEGGVSLAGAHVGTAAGRDVAWDDLTVTANGEAVVGLSLFLARDDGFGAKVVARDHDFAVGDVVSVDFDHVDAGREQP